MDFRAVMVVGAVDAGPNRPHGLGEITALEHVANRPIVHHVLDELGAADIQQVIITGSADALLDVRRSLRTYTSRRAEIEYAVCGPSVASALRAAAPLLEGDACLLQPADGLLGEPIEPLFALLGDDAADVRLLVESETGASVAPGRLPASRGGLRTYADARTEPAAAVFGPGVVRRVDGAVGSDTMADLRTVADRLADGGAIVRSRAVQSWRRYRGRGDELLELNRVALDKLIAAPESWRTEGNRIDGRVQIHPTATIDGSVIVGPVVIGANAQIIDAYIGPYTSIGDGARIEGSEVERSIVASGASVLHVGGRLASSIVGRDARVFRDFSLPRAMRLWVGDGDEIALS